jgi:hypothetical protein
MSHSKAPSGVRTRTFAYEDFQGLDTSRDLVSKDTGRSQHLEVLDNAFCDWRGQIVRDPACAHRHGSRVTSHVAFFASGETAYAERTEAGTNLVSEREHRLDNAFPPRAVIASAVFNRKVQFFSRGQQPVNYDGTIYRPSQSAHLGRSRPAFAASVQRRLAVAGGPGEQTRVLISRVDNEDIFPDDEPPDSNNVLRAGFIDVVNLLGTADQITGLGAFEQNRLIIFAADKALIYRIDPDITEWRQDETANIQIGCASHNTIVNAGTDVLFCSRSGIHSITRSTDNGILVFSFSLSDKVDLLYRELFDSVENPQEISAVFDQDRARYHIFFPQRGGVLCRRLTLALNPEGGEAQPKFSTGSFLNARCGAFLAGTLALGTSGGVHEVLADGQGRSGAVVPQFEMVTPMLWHGSLVETKETMSLVIQAAGKGFLVLDAVDDQGRQIGSMEFEVTDDPDDNHFFGVPLSRQYERKWQHRYRGAQYRIRSKGGDGLLRLIGLAVNVRA